MVHSSLHIHLAAQGRYVWLPMDYIRNDVLKVDLVVVAINVSALVAQSKPVWRDKTSTACTWKGSVVTTYVSYSNVHSK